MLYPIVCYPIHNSSHLHSALSPGDKKQRDSRNCRNVEIWTSESQCNVGIYLIS